MSLLTFRPTVFLCGMSLLLYAFRYKHPRTGKWVKARYRAGLREIRDDHAEFELIGEPEIREPRAGSFNPYRTADDPND